MTATTTRHFTVLNNGTTPFDVNQSFFVETDADGKVISRTNTHFEERKALLRIADTAASLARVTGSVSATYVDTLFGTELRVTWKRTS